MAQEFIALKAKNGSRKNLCVVKLYLGGLGGKRLINVNIIIQHNLHNLLYFNDIEVNIRYIIGLVAF